MALCFDRKTSQKARTTSKKPPSTLPHAAGMMLHPRAALDPGPNPPAHMCATGGFCPKTDITGNRAHVGWSENHFPEDFLLDVWTPASNVPVTAPMNEKPHPEVEQSRDVGTRDYEIDQILAAGPARGSTC